MGEDVTPSPTGVVGVVVAGGQALRLGGGDKTLRPIGGRPMLQGLLARLAPQCDALAINANGDAARFAAFALPVLADDPQDRACGPLAGVLAALAWAAEHHPRAGALLTVPGDVPDPPLDLVHRLAAVRHPDGAAAASSGGRAHPLVALWPVHRRAALAELLRDAGERRVEAALRHLGVQWVTWPVQPRDPFHNVNTPDDLAAADRMAAEPR